MKLKFLRAKVLLLPAALLTVLLAGCNSAHPDRTHNADLLDDKVTAQRVQAALQRAGPQFNHVHAGVTNGTVVLSGSVSSPQLRQQAEDIAKSSHRARKLENDLDVVK